MAIEKKLPKWVEVSLEHLKSITAKINVLKKEGLAETKRGLEKVKEANNLQIEVDYLGRVLSQEHDPSNWNDEIVTISGDRLANRIVFLDEDLDKMLDYTKDGGRLDDEYHRRFIFDISGTNSTSGTAIYLGASIEKRFQAINPSFVSKLGGQEPTRLTSRDTLFQELKNTLEDFGEKYVTMLEGSETALEIGTPDSLNQAAHSMRDCFQQLLEVLAPSKVVESQPWFQTANGAPGGISRRSRLRYMLYGSGENVDDRTIRQLDEQSDIAKVSLDLCIARAHDHEPSLTKEEVLLGIDQARSTLLHVLRLYNSFRIRRKDTDKG